MSPDATFAGEITTHIRNNAEAGTYFRIAHCSLIGVPVISICRCNGEAGYKVFLDDSWVQLTLRKSVSRTY